MKSGSKSIIAGNKAENKTENRTPILYEATAIRCSNGSYWDCNAVSAGWRCNIFIGCVAVGDFLVTDKRKGYDILERRI